MRLAWFRPEAPVEGWDDLAVVIDDLRQAHTVTVIHERHAHDFVWQWARGAFDLCVYELVDTPAHQYIWPYLLHYPGILALRASTLHRSRMTAMARQRRDGDYAAEMAFSEGPQRLDAPWLAVQGPWPMLRVPVLASRLVATADDALAATLARDYPTGRVRCIGPGVDDPGPSTRSATTDDVVFGLADPESADVAAHAAARARANGFAVRVARAGTLVDTVREADVVMATRWPLLGRPLISAIAGAAAGKPVIVTETEGTAGWPALDPQTWQPRGGLPGAPPPGDAPIVVSIDPRDEEHSLMLAMQRLSSDAALRQSLGAAARAWWRSHATRDRAAAAWQALLQEATGLEPPPRPGDWPAHLTADGEELARRLLAQMDLAIDWQASYGAGAEGRGSQS